MTKTTSLAAVGEGAPARNPITEVRAQFEKMSTQIQAVLPAHISVDKFQRVALTAIQMNPALMQADRQTLFGACLKCASDGLIPDGREAALVEFKAKQKDGTFRRLVQYQPMIAGIRKKVRNAGCVENWATHIVKERDEFDYELGDNERITHKPARGDRGKTIAAYSIVTLKGGEKSREVMFVEDLDRIRARSRSGDRGPWATDTDEMYRKTVAKRHAKSLPLSADIEDLVARDNSVFRADQRQQTVAEEPVYGDEFDEEVGQEDRPVADDAPPSQQEPPRQARQQAPKQQRQDPPQQREPQTYDNDAPDDAGGWE